MERLGNADIAKQMHKVCSSTKSVVKGNGGKARQPSMQASHVIPVMSASGSQQCRERERKRERGGTLLGAKGIATRSKEATREIERETLHLKS